MTRLILQGPVTNVIKTMHCFLCLGLRVSGVLGSGFRVFPDPQKRALRTFGD